MSEQELLEEIAPELIKSEKDTEKQEQNGFLAALITAGFTSFLASAIINALSDDEKVVDLLRQNKRPLIFMTQQDSKVDDIICLPQQGDVWEEDDSKRPRIPEDTHENCRCFWQDPITGKNLGQF